MERNSKLKPRVAVVGSCISRDVFNSEILGENYKDEVEVVSTVYQTALSSLVRDSAIDLDLRYQVKGSHRKYIEQECSGKSIENIIAANPDVIVMDFFADIHFGTVNCSDKVLTRNTMAFDDFGVANTYFENNTNERNNFVYYGDSYSQVAVKSMATFLTKLSDKGLTPKVIVNSGRYATEYSSREGDTRGYDRNINRLVDRNRSWDVLDSTIVEIFNCEQIKYPNELFMGDEDHKWGLHPVHYKSEFYKHLWKSIQNLIQ